MYVVMAGVSHHAIFIGEICDLRHLRRAHFMRNITPVLLNRRIKLSEKMSVTQTDVFETK